MTVYGRLGMRRVINAAGKLTSLGGSAVADVVAETMCEAAKQHVEIEHLMTIVGDRIAQLLGAEGAVVTSCAAAGICISVAALIAGTDAKKIEQLPHTSDRNEVIILKGHCINFGAPVVQMIRLGGGNPRILGGQKGFDVEQLKQSIGENTVGIIYVQSYMTDKEPISLQNCIDLAHEMHIPIIVDAAAEEDLWAYPKSGIDLTIYSGSKAPVGPTSGFIVGRKRLIDACYMQYKGIGRPMKISKETLMGLITALEEYEKTFVSRMRTLRDSAQYIADGLDGIPGVEASIAQDENRKSIFRAKLTIDPDIVGVSGPDVIARLADGDPAIFVRTNASQNDVIMIDPRPVAAEETAIVIDRLRGILFSP